MPQQRFEHILPCIDPLNNGRVLGQRGDLEIVHLLLSVLRRNGGWPVALPRYRVAFKELRLSDRNICI